MRISDADGGVAAHVVAVSYPTAHAFQINPIGWRRGFARRRWRSESQPELIDTLGTQINGLPFVLTGHLHVAGGIELEGAERRILVGGQHAVPHDVFTAEADYVALGHLHKAQAVGRDSVRYSGSLIPLSATELQYQHGVTLVSLDGAVLGSEHIPIARPVPFLRLPADGDLRLNEFGDHLSALSLPPDLPLNERPFIQVRPARHGLPPGFREEMDRVAESFPVRVVDTRVAAMPNVPHEAVIADLSVRLADRDPEELFKLAFERAFGVAPDAAHLDIFHRARVEG